MTKWNVYESNKDKLYSGVKIYSNNIWPNLFFIWYYMHIYISFILKLIFPNVWFKVFSVWAFRAYWIRCWWTTNITRQSSWNQLPALAPHFSLLWIQLLRSGSDFLTGFLFYIWETVIWFPVSPFSLFNLLSPVFLL